MENFQPGLPRSRYGPSGIPANRAEIFPYNCTAPLARTDSCWHNQVICTPFFITTSNFGAEAESSNLFWEFQSQMLLNISFSKCSRK